MPRQVNKYEDRQTCRENGRHKLTHLDTVRTKKMYTEIQTDIMEIQINRQIDRNADRQVGRQMEK